jgi:glycogen debranching enzyme
MAHRILQEPAPGTALLCHRGDPVVISVLTPQGGTAWLRTNALSSAIRRAEIIDAVENGAPRPGQDWQDLPMTMQANGQWFCTLTLQDTGCFEAKAYWLPDNADAPQWAEGGDGNLRFKVQPAWTVSRCSVYSAFVRMFRPAAPEHPAAAAELDAAGWTVIPPSGTFRALTDELPRIIDTMGFRIVMLLPPFPVPTTHARMGRYGSPFAAMDYYSVDPACGVHDLRTMPLEQFDELTDAIHARGAKLFIDIPINHTGWASQIMQRHPEWFKRNPDGEFHSPGAWGVTWADLVELDYLHRALWREMANVFLYWCRRGVDGFRCDAGYMIPVPVWEYITAKVRREFPDTVFFLEGLGGKISVMMELLTTGGLDWAYSELFQNYDRGAIDWYLPQAIAQSATHGLQLHFAETHDNNRLAARGPVWARMRTALCALASPSGAWGITCGVEWLAADKVHVHGASPLNTGAEPNLVREIAALNTLLGEHPAFHSGAVLEIITKGDGPVLALRRKPAAGGQSVLIVANLGDQTAAVARWNASAFTPACPGACLWTGVPLSVGIESELFFLELPPGAVYCVPSEEPVVTVVPVAQASLSDALVVTLPRDERRTIVWPAGEPLVIAAPAPFNSALLSGGTVTALAESSPQTANLHHARLPFTEADTLRAELHQQGTLNRVLIPLTQSPAGRVPASSASPLALCSTLSGEEIRSSADLHLLLTNGTGAMTHIRAAWGAIRTQYDALLAANPHASVPVDRRMLFNRCRAWVVRRGFSTELSAAWTTEVRLLSPGHAAWDFHLPCGDGHWIDLTVIVHLAAGENRLLIHFERRGGSDETASLILRPDIEDRGFHDKTVFSDDNLAVMSTATAARPSGFRQPCHHGGLYMNMEGASFVVQPERLTVSHPQDIHRGLGGSSDLFSPGYFEIKLPSGGTAVLDAALAPHGMEPPDLIPPLPATVPHTLKAALMQFVVRRDEGKTIIAGYPWFLDWGRDTLIVLRGLIAAGELQTSRDILKTFAGFEENGTIPNMIRGNDCSNRSTSDAPLWLCVATADLLAAENSDAFLDETAGGRPIREILRSIAAHYISGTTNGIRMDPASGLIWSPSHYTWMDTNYPAGTPREGYPIDIQALWHGTLTLLARIDPAGEWAALAAKVRHSIAALYTKKTPEFLSDCLHAPSGTPAANAIADDHLRPNQLLAITLGAVTDPGVAQRIITSSMELLVPGAIRTLADRPVTFALPVYRDGHLLNHPHAPFWPHYQGDEDTRRKPAYHNGTAWPWPMPALPEAILLTGGSVTRARAILASMLPLSSTFCLGHLPEIMDAATPHSPGGCGAQAWSVSELLRVEKFLSVKEAERP